MEPVEYLKWYHRPYHEKRNGFSTLRTFKTANVLIYALDFFRNQSRAAHSCTEFGVAKRTNILKTILKKVLNYVWRTYTDFVYYQYPETQIFNFVSSVLNKLLMT